MNAHHPSRPHADSRSGSASARGGGLSIRAALLCCAIAILALAAAPGWAWTAAVSTWPLVAHAVAFPVAAGLALCLLGCLWLTLLVVVKKPSCLLTTWKLQPALSAASALVLAAAGVVMLLPDPMSAPQELGGGATHIAGDAAGRRLKVVSWNTHEEPVSAQLQQLIVLENPDVLVLPETVTEGQDWGEYQAFQSTNGRSTPTSVLVHRRLGSYREVDGPATAIGSVTLAPERAGLPTIVGVHPVPPLPGLMSEWRADVLRVVDWGEAQAGPLLIAGDFNATRHHGAMSQRHTLLAVPATGTWPQNVPALFGAPIDHVLVKARPDGAVAVPSSEVLSLNASDHRAIIAEVVFS